MNTAVRGGCSRETATQLRSPALSYPSRRHRDRVLSDHGRASSIQPETESSPFKKLWNLKQPTKRSMVLPSCLFSLKSVSRPVASSKSARPEAIPKPVTPTPRRGISKHAPPARPSDGQPSSWQVRWESRVHPRGPHHRLCRISFQPGGTGFSRRPDREMQA